ncbi:methyltransferase domain-containing protein [Thioalkalicoccus limnaeus]|uniref:Methyltransferase domain-containing protein n=1 Tax=Thioalkalicoccus limnaeus TaxID=120681 RepID=A0ABV4BCD7_9GAMM
MKRCSALRRLSVDHHRGLVIALRARRAQDAVAAWHELGQRFADELEPHFALEEAGVLPALEAAGETRLVERICDEHGAMRALIAQGGPDDLLTFADLLEAHIRFEEASLFAAAQQILPTAVLDELQALHDKAPAPGCAVPGAHHAARPAPPSEASMQINDPAAYRRVEAIDLMAELVDLRGRRVLELGCGAAHLTRAMATRLGAARITATEVDRRQHACNLTITDLPQVSFRYGGAEAIADPAASYDLVVMLKSLHHVQIDHMDRALAEIHRVLVPDGLLYVCEPVYWGDFNALLRLIEDEQEVRQAAFEALRRAVASGRFELVREVFFESEGVYPDWASFAARFIDVTFVERRLDDTRIDTVRAAFEQHLTPEGVRLWKPHRVDLLRRVE